MSNYKLGVGQLMLLVISMVVVLTVGNFIWGNITGNIGWTDVQYPESYNATVNQVDSIFNIGPMVFGIAFVLIVIAGAIGWVSIPSGITERNKYFKFLASSLHYFIWGLFGLVCVLPVFGLALFLYDFVVVQGNTASLLSLGKWLLLLIVGYFSIAGFGYMWKHVVVDRVKKKLAQRKYKQQMDELPISSN